MSTAPPADTPPNQSSETPNSHSKSNSKGPTAMLLDYDTLDQDSRDAIDAADLSAALDILNAAEAGR